MSTPAAAAVMEFPLLQQTRELVEAAKALERSRLDLIDKALALSNHRDDLSFAAACDVSRRAFDIAVDAGYVDAATGESENWSVLEVGQLGDLARDASELHEVATFFLSRAIEQVAA